MRAERTPSLAPPERPVAETGINTRQESILEIVRAKGFATIESLAEEFSVSTQTVRRDVIRLDEAGLLQRFHGGAGVAPDGDPVRLGYRTKREMHAAPKERIGALAASLIEDGSSVYLDVGTTVEAVARNLAGRDLRSAHTNSLNAAGILGGARQFETYVTGGVVRGADGSLVGDAAARMFESIAVDVAILGCSGFAGDGTPMDFDPQKVAVKQAVLRNARRVLVVADASKFERQAVVLIAPPARFSAVVTDNPPPSALARQLQKAGVEIAVARQS